MRLTLSAYVQVERDEGRSIYHCRPLHGPQIATRDPLLSVALNKLGSKMRKSVGNWIERGEVSRIGDWLYDSESRAVSIKLMLALRDRTLRWKLLVVCAPAFSRLVAFSPSIPDVSFELDSAVDLEMRASEVYAQWAQAQVAEGNEFMLEGIGGGGEMWVEPLEVEVETQVKHKPKAQNIFAALLGSERISGNEELHKVGQCLDEFVNDYQPAIGRAELVDEVDRLLHRDDRQGVLLIGPPAAGKTAILQECVARRVERFRRRRDQKPQVWWLSPQRLISGMSYLGQWEQRWLAILREASKRDHILYFDDLVGLFTAGRTRDSSLSAADVLRSFLAEHPLRILAESTHEQLAVLRRRDRALADRFHLVRVPALNADDALPITLEAVYGIELRAAQYFHPETVPVIIRHQETFAPDQAFPGKAIEMCKALTKHSTQSVTQKSVLRLAGAQMGANPALLLGGLGDQRTIQQTLSRQLIGQPAAVEALGRTVIRYTQHLHAPDRPLGVLLLLGPTGVGKTEAAKALTRLLFTDEARLVRLDMNELTTAHAAEQLVGTFDLPEGRLTAAVRRQPNCVILLDEIEKAHPDVFDYLLQVLGEGRLTDARGRVADFRSAVIIMTSNLGATEQSSNLGFEVSAERRQQIYVKAAQQFFRPEFFNRLDEVVAFGNLDPHDMQKIVAIQMDQVLSRDGIKRREIFVKVEDSAIRQVIHSGYDSKLGARAVRRMLESQVIGPLADCLSGMSIDHPALVQISHQPSDTKLSCRVIELAKAQAIPRHPTLENEVLMERGAKLYERLDERLSGLQDELRHVDCQATGKLHAASYYALREQLYRCAEALKVCKNKLRRTVGPRLDSVPVTPATPRRDLDASGTRRGIRDWHAQNDLRSAVAEQESDAEGFSLPQATRQLIAHLTVAEVMIDTALAPRTWLIGFDALTQGLSSSDAELNVLSNHQRRHSEAVGDGSIAGGAISSLVNCLQHGWQYEVAQRPSVNGFHLVSGVSLWGIVKPLLGTYQVELPGTSASHLLCLRAIAVLGGTSIADLEQVLAARVPLENHGKLLTPSQQPWPTTTIRGLLGNAMIDYISGASVELGPFMWLDSGRAAARTQQWWIECLPVPSELQSALLPESPPTPDFDLQGP
jgi:ATP-dependent Clp protease ATP-binding subunit ClpC